MAFLLEPVVQNRFKSFKDVDTWLSIAMERFKDRGFVVNARSGKFLGAVSASYVFYSNQDFIQDLQDLLTGGQTALFAKDSLGRFRYVDGFSVNTHFFLRFVLRVESGRVIGPGGEGEDISEIGIQFKNSMVGAHGL